MAENKQKPGLTLTQAIDVDKIAELFKHLTGKNMTDQEREEVQQMLEADQKQASGKANI